MGPVSPGVAAMSLPRLSPEDSVNVRDILSAFVGKGYTNLKEEDARKMFGFLRAKLGDDTANKLLSHLSIYNQRPDMLQQNADKRIQSLYDIGSHDPVVDNILRQTKNVAQGPMSGYNDSPLVPLRQVADKLPAVGPTAGVFVNPGTASQLYRQYQGIR